jgi:hypothetical protein
LEQLERKDLLAFMGILKADGKEARTVANHISFLKVFFVATASPALCSKPIR